MRPNCKCGHSSPVHSFGHGPCQIRIGPPPKKRGAFVDLRPYCPCKKYEPAEGKP